MMRLCFLRTSGGIGSAKPRCSARFSTSSMHSLTLRVSMECCLAWADWRYRATILPTLSPMGSNSGLAMLGAPRNHLTLPKRCTCMPSLSCFARQGWLKKVHCSVPVPSSMSIWLLALGPPFCHCRPPKFCWAVTLVISPMTTTSLSGALPCQRSPILTD